MAWRPTAILQEEKERPGQRGCWEGGWRAGLGQDGGAGALLVGSGSWTHSNPPGWVTVPSAALLSHPQSWEGARSHGTTDPRLGVVRVWGDSGKGGGSREREVKAGGRDHCQRH